MNVTALISSDTATNTTTNKNELPITVPLHSYEALKDRHVSLFGEKGQSFDSWFSTEHLIAEINSMQNKAKAMKSSLSLKKKKRRTTAKTKKRSSKSKDEGGEQNNLKTRRKRTKSVTPEPANPLRRKRKRDGGVMKDGKKKINLPIQSLEFDSPPPTFSNIGKKRRRRQVIKIDPSDYLFPLQPSDYLGNPNSYIDMNRSDLFYYDNLKENIYPDKGVFVEYKKKVKIVPPSEESIKEQKEADLQLTKDRARLTWCSFMKREAPRASRQYHTQRATMLSNAKKTAQSCQKELKRKAIKNSKPNKDVILRAKKLAKDTLAFWRRYEKEEREAKKRAEKLEAERRKHEEELREAKRQQKKLNFLITQTELYSHFIGKKMGMTDTEPADIPTIPQLPALDQDENEIDIERIEEINEEDEIMKQTAIKNAEMALSQQMEKTRQFDELTKRDKGEQSKQLPMSPMITSSGIDAKISQPKMFQNGTLKEYQLKGLNWLINLYEQGINGILADEMGLGKTIQSIGLLAYLAESRDIWGPFLIVSPASTLHNWQQELAKFTPDFKVLPYWGSQNDRKAIRRFWNPKHLNSQNAPFHILITSYNIVVTDERYFHRLKWQYMILDEAQALKSSTSARWKTLLGLNCRNRLLLTGTPIQNSMAELWALLHFIMPTLFDSHQEFTEWFSKDIEQHAESSTGLNEHQLSRLHMILKPFMLRRVKKEVEHEMAEKIELEVDCPLSVRQRQLYRLIKGQISVSQLLADTSMSDAQVRHLMNLVMQFRKVCNHPEIFEKREPQLPFWFSDMNDAFESSHTIPYFTLGAEINPISFTIPTLVYHDMTGQHSTLSPSIEIASTKQNLYKQFNLFSAANVDENISGSFSFARLIDLTPGELEWLYTTSNILERHYMNYLTKRRNNLLSYYFTLSDLTAPSKNMLIVPSNVPVSSDFRASVLQEMVTSPEDRFSENISMLKTLRFVLPKSMAAPITAYVSTKSFIYQQELISNSSDIKYLLTGNSFPRCAIKLPVSLVQNESQVRDEIGSGMIKEVHQRIYGSNVKIPSFSQILRDSGKLIVLDQLLTRLKAEGHRVLIYSQMTKMINILEDFMSYRKHKYIRLDGSSKLTERGDLVHSFQTRPDIFAFLLSTRAGGLGINLTAADTVIFYDSDWNPTMDAQAMDRAHRLGQTRQVTVYRLVTRGTIEERILQRAQQKNTIQSIVIAGKFKDSFRPQEVVSMLLDDEEVKEKVLKQQEERKSKRRGRPPKKGSEAIGKNNKNKSSADFGLGWSWKITNKLI